LIHWGIRHFLKIHAHNAILQISAISFLNDKSNVIILVIKAVEVAVQIPPGVQNGEFDLGLATLVLLE
jgi:hypothetical protein